MESIYTELALFGSTNDCARTDSVYLPISEVCNGTVSLQKSKLESEINCSPKKIKVSENEAFVFEDTTKVYRYVSESEGYQCPMCLTEFGQLGHHISSSKCGENIDVKRFTAKPKNNI